MSENFDALNAVVAVLVGEIQEAIALLQAPPAPDNQAAIDDITSRLSASADALAASLPAAAPAPAPSDGSSTPDVQP